MEARLSSAPPLFHVAIPRAVLSPVAAAILVVAAVFAMPAGCGSQRLRPALPDILPGAPPPESASEGTDLQIQLERARQQIAELTAKTNAALDPLGVFRWAAFAAFAAVPLAWLIAGVRGAVIALLIASAIAFLPLVLIELWAALKWPVTVASCILGAAYLAYWLGQLWRRWREGVALDARLAASRDAQIAGGHMEGAAAAEVLRLGAEDQPEMRKAIKTRMGR